MKTWDSLIQAADRDILCWARAQPWAEPMMHCLQEAEWHAEGDVWTHTCMVFEEILRLPDYAGLDRREQVMLLLVALLHDAGKPATSVKDPDTGRIRSPKHSIVGAGMARRILRELSCELATREHIVNLVRYHGRPPYFLDAQEPEREVIRLSWLLSNLLLHLFALADTRGRTAANTARSVATLDLWRDTAQELGCLRGGYPFANDHARFLFYRHELSSLHFVPHEEFRCTVTMLSGLPGAGKDFWLARNLPGLPVVSLDAVREELDIDAADNQGQVIQAAREKCRECLRAGCSFAFNATNLTVQLRRRWIDLFSDYGARVEIVYIEPRLATILRQNREREDSVPERIIFRLLDKMEIPTVTEAHRVEFAATD